MIEQVEEHLRAIFADEAQHAPSSETLERQALEWTKGQHTNHRVRTAFLIVAAAALAAVTVAGISIGLDRSGSSAVPIPVVVGPDNRHGPISSSGAMSCVKEYSTTTLKARAFAFDGTAIAIGPSVSDKPGSRLDAPGVTFEVNEWFHGGSADTVTVDIQGISTGEDGAASEFGWPSQIPEGTRLLVSGEPRWGGNPLDRAIAWGCGFTRYYDQETADQWRTAFPDPAG